MGMMTNPLMALMRKRAGGMDSPPDPNALAGTYPDAASVDIGLQDPQALPSAPQPPSNGLNFQPDTDVLGPRLNPVKGLMQKLGFALGDAVRKQFGMPTDEELAQQDFENRLKVKQYKMQEQAAVSQEELRKQQIEESRAENQMINVPGVGNVRQKDMPQVMNMLATQKYHEEQMAQRQAEQKDREDAAAEALRTRLQIHKENLDMRGENATANLGIRREFLDLARQNAATRAETAAEKADQLTPAAAKTLEETAPVSAQIDDLLGQFEPTKGDNTPGKHFKDRALYMAGIKTESPAGKAGDTIAQLELNRVVGAARVLKGSSRAIAALNKAMTHLPNVWVDSDALIYSKLSNLKQALAQVEESAKKYGRKGYSVNEDNVAPPTGVIRLMRDPKNPGKLIKQ